MTTVQCKGCKTSNEADPAANAFRCANCGTFWRFAVCPSTRKVVHVSAKKNKPVKFVCPHCGSRHAIGAVDDQQKIVSGVGVVLPNAQYLGGLTRAPNKSFAPGNLRFTRTHVGPGTMRLKAEDAKTLAWTEVAHVEVAGGQVSKSKVGAVVAFGVLGGLAGKGAKNQTAVVIHLLDGSAAYYQIDKADPLAVRAKIAPVLHEAGVRFTDDEQPSPPAQAHAPDVADQIRKLAALMDDGLISSAEFQAQKLKLLG